MTSYEVGVGLRNEQCSNSFPLALALASTLADDYDMKPLSKMTTEEAKAARAPNSG